MFKEIKYLSLILTSMIILCGAVAVPHALAESNTSASVVNNTNTTISSNGGGSVTVVDGLSEVTHPTSVLNIATIINNINAFLNTGGNSTNDNLGDVAIRTGDVISEISVNNSVNGLDFTCCDPGDPPINSNNDQPSAPAPSNALSGSGLTFGLVAGAAFSLAGGNILPITPTNWLFLAIVGNVLLLIFGACLRLHSGNSPGAALGL